MSVFEEERQSGLIIPGLSVPGDADFAALERGLARERQWFADAPRFQSDEDVQAAIVAGELQELHNSLDVRRIARFEVQAPGFTPFLRPRAWQAVHDFSQLWRDILDEDSNRYEVSPRRLAITSMVRSQAYQNRLIVQGKKLASPDSTHCVGMAFDVDVSAYYYVYSDGIAHSASDPRRASGQLAIAGQLQQRYGDTHHAITGQSLYVASVTDAAVAAARIMHNQGVINLVEEFTGTENACLHIAVSPEYQAA